MTFISYAQNLEDVMLWRALKNYRSGFYIDVGACDPEVDSVTKAFYDRGWRGINIEPVPAAFEKISAERPRDINLNIAAAASNGIVKFYSVDGGNGLSTTVKHYAEKYGANARKVDEFEVATKSLSQICAAFVNQDVSFLKIDVEGGEKAVLEGADFERFRPWIVVVESTEPNTTKPSHGEWEPILLNARYTYVYFDGLNRYYVANEKLELLGPAFCTPPNWFDHYETSKTANLRDVNEKISQTLSSIESIPFPSFIADEKMVVGKIEKLIENHLFLSQKLTEEIAEAGSLPVVTPTLDGRQTEIQMPLGHIDDLKAQLNTLHIEADQSASETARMQAELTRLQEENQHFLNENNVLKRENSRLNQEADALHQELYEGSRHIGAMSKDRSNMHAAIASLEHQVRHYTHHYNLSQQLVEQRDAAAKQSRDVHAAHEGQFNALAAESTQLHKDIATLHGHIAALDARIVAMHSENAAMERDALAMGHQISALDARILAMHAENTAMERDALALRDQIASLHAQIAGLLGSRSWRLTAPLRGIPLLSNKGGKIHG